MNHTDQQVLELLRTNTYEQVHEVTGWSRGRIYALALKSGARKTESRIRERASERKQRQIDALKAMVNATTTADVLDFLDAVPDDSVAVHFTSPPYNLGKAYGNAPGADALKFTYYHGWLMQVISEMARTLKPGGVVCLQTGKTRDWDNILMPLDVLLYEDLRRAGLTFQSRVVWEIKHGLTPAARLAERYETILVFSKGPQVCFNPNACRFPQRQPGKRAFKGPNKGCLSGNPLGAFPTDVWADITQVMNNHPDRAHGDHPAQFPVGLAKRAILMYSRPGDLICDPFRGSGSTAVAAKEAHRDFVGADLFYNDLCERRLAAAQADKVSPLNGVTDESVAVWQAEARRIDHKANPVSNAQDRSLCVQMGLLEPVALSA
jgi:DNA modification methylase